MKPFIFRFIDFRPVEPIVDSVVEYSGELNLNVLSSTAMPAVEILKIDGETITKAGQEPTDCQHSSLLKRLKSKLEEVTVTLSLEGTDKLKQCTLNNLIEHIQGETITATLEPTDKVRVSDFINAIGGLTITRVEMETTDVR
jgi:hypothetical protein